MDELLAQLKEKDIAIEKAYKIISILNIKLQDQTPFSTNIKPPKSLKLIGKQNLPEKDFLKEISDSYQNEKNCYLNKTNSLKQENLELKMMISTLEKNKKNYETSIKSLENIIQEVNKLKYNNLIILAEK